MGKRAPFGEALFRKRETEDLEVERVCTHGSASWMAALFSHLPELQGPNNVGLKDEEISAYYDSSCCTKIGGPSRWSMQWRPEHM